jgi:hypothetical protein
MMRWIAMFFSLVCALSTLAIAPGQDAAPPPAGPRLELSAAEWNFGDVWQGVDLRTEMSIRNSGTAPLIITEFTGSCGCTPVRKPKLTLQPGESDTFEIRYDSLKHVGRAQQHVLIKSNDPATPEFRLKVLGNVRMLYSLSNPSGAAFGRLTPEMRETAVIEIRNAHVSPLTLALRPLPDDAVIAAALREKEAGRVYEIEVTTRPPLRMGAWNGSIVLDANYESLRELHVPYSMLVHERVVLEPATLILPFAATNPMPRAVRIAHLADRPLKITQLRCPVPEITAEIVPEGIPATRAGRPDHFRYLQVRFATAVGYELPADGVDVELMTDDPEFPRLALKLKGQRAAESRARTVKASRAGPRPPRGGPPASQPASAPIP